MADTKKILKTTIAIAVPLGSLALLWIYRDDIKRIAKKTFGGQLWFDKSLQWWREGSWGVKTYNELQQLHPDFRGKVKKFFDDVEKELGYQMIIISGYRTPEEQANLNEEIKAKPNFSYHNYGFAIDTNPMKDGKIILNSKSPKSAWIESGIVSIAKRYGFEWGVNNESDDFVHFYIRPKGMKTDELYSLLLDGKTDKDGYVKV